MMSYRRCVNVKRTGAHTTFAVEVKGGMNFTYCVSFFPT